MLFEYVLFLSKGFIERSIFLFVLNPGNSETEKYLRESISLYLVMGVGGGGWQLILFESKIKTIERTKERDIIRIRGLGRKFQV